MELPKLYRKVWINKQKCKLGFHKWKTRDELGYTQHGKRFCTCCKKAQSAVLSCDGVEWFTTYKGNQ